MINVYMKSIRGCEYDAKGFYKDGKLTVLKGSKIRIKKENNYKRNKFVDTVRNDKKYVDNGIVIKDIEFSSPSTAAQFLIDQSINGKNFWRDENRKKLKDLI